MALAFSVRRSYKLGNRTQKVVEVTFDDSYPNNGEAITAANVGLKHIDNIQCEPAVAADGATAVLVAWDRTNSKLLAFESGASGAVFPEKGDTESLATYVASVTVTGY